MYQNHRALANRTCKHQAGVKDVITLFHNAKNPASVRVYTLLKQANATAVAHATEDQASSHDKQSKLERTEFQLGTHKHGKTMRHGARDLGC